MNGLYCVDCLRETPDEEASEQGRCISCETIHNCKHSNVEPVINFIPDTPDSLYPFKCADCGKRMTERTVRQAGQVLHEESSAAVLRKPPKRKAKGRDRRTYAVGSKMYQERKLAREERRLERIVDPSWSRVDKARNIICQEIMDGCNDCKDGGFCDRHRIIALEMSADPAKVINLDTLQLRDGIEV